MITVLAGMTTIEKIVVFGVLALIVYGAFMGKGGKNGGGGSSSSSSGTGGAS